MSGSGVPIAVDPRAPSGKAFPAGGAHLEGGHTSVECRPCPGLYLDRVQPLDNVTRVLCCSRCVVVLVIDDSPVQETIMSSEYRP